MNRASYPWFEEAPGQQQSTMNFAADAASAVMNFVINGDDLRKMIPHILGYAKVEGGAGVGFTLRRQTPARHPLFAAMRATKIMEIRGKGPYGQYIVQGDGGIPRPSVMQGGNGNPKFVNEGNQYVLQGSGGVFRRWQQYMVSVLFELPTYDIREDGEIGVSEYNRNVTKTYRTNVESLARRGENWEFINARARARTTAFNGDLLLRQPKGVLEWIWHDVPEDWIMIGKLIPSNFLACVGTVNLHEFPMESLYRDQNDPLGQTVVDFPPGTLLLLPAEITPRVQVDDRVVAMSLIAGNATSYLPRTYDVKIQWVHFNPPTDDDTKVILVGGPEDGVLVRGHNLVPLPQPSSTGRNYYAAVKTSLPDVGPIPAPTSPLPNDKGLLYQYQNHEHLFSYARSMAYWGL